MKKIILITSFLFMFLLFIGCNLNTSNISTTTPENQMTTTNYYLNLTGIRYPDYPVDESFFYAEVMIYFVYEDFSSSYYDLSRAREYYETNNQELFGQSGLEAGGNFDRYYLSSLSPFGSLTYVTKEGFFQDFNLIKNAYLNGYIASPNVFLNTVGEQIRINEETTITNIFSLTEKFYLSELTYDSIDFEILKVSETIADYDLYDDLIDLVGAYVIDNYSEYLNIYPENDFSLEESFFDSKLLVYGRFGHSGSMIIEGVSDLFYLKANLLEISVDFSAISTMMTCDWQPYSFVISMDKTDYQTETEIIIHLHGFYLNGYLFDRPHHNIYDDN